MKKTDPDVHDPVGRAVQPPERPRHALAQCTCPLARFAGNGGHQRAAKLPVR